MLVPLPPDTPLNQAVQMQGMLQNPDFLNQMSAIMSDPAIIEQVIASNPALAGMGPRVRELLQSEGFRQMMCVHGSH